MDSQLGTEMRPGKRLIVGLINRMYFLERKLLSTRAKTNLLAYVSRIFEQEAINCYIADTKDIGFFETFILGSDETKKIASETDEAMKIIRHSELKERLAGYVPSSSRRYNEAQELMKDDIDEKKRRVIDKLQEKGEVIKYLGRRITCRDEKLYEVLERLYNKLSEDLARSPDEEIKGER